MPDIKFLRDDPEAVAGGLNDLSERLSRLTPAERSSEGDGKGMSEKTPSAREDEQEDLLEQIIAQGLAKMNTPAREEAQEASAPNETPSAQERKAVEEAAPPAGRKNKPSAVLYLLILSGAACSMLLACFIQLRGSESTISDLRESQAELLDQIRELEDQNAALDEGLEFWEANYSELQGRYRETVQEANNLWDQNDNAQKELYAWRSFWTLEKFYQAGDYQSCAALLILLEQESQYTYRTPDGAQLWYEEIVRAVIDAGILDEKYYMHPNDYNDLLDAYFSNIVYGLAESGTTVVTRVTER